eukprot:768478-Hanusia_phi.AAC.11
MTWASPQTRLKDHPIRVKERRERELGEMRVIGSSRSMWYRALISVGAEDKIEVLRKQNANLIEAIMRSNPELNARDFLERVDDICEADSKKSFAEEALHAHSERARPLLRTASSSPAASKPSHTSPALGGGVDEATPC